MGTRLRRNQSKCLTMHSAARGAGPALSPFRDRTAGPADVEAAFFRIERESKAACPNPPASLSRPKGPQNGPSRRKRRCRSSSPRQHCSAWPHCHNLHHSAPISGVDANAPGRNRSDGRYRALPHSLATRRRTPLLVETHVGRGSRGGTIAVLGSGSAFSGPPITFAYHRVRKDFTAPQGLTNAALPAISSAVT